MRQVRGQADTIRYLSVNHVTVRSVEGMHENQSHEVFEVRMFNIYGILCCKNDTLVRIVRLVALKNRYLTRPSKIWISPRYESCNKTHVSLL